MAVWQATFEFSSTTGFPLDFRERLDRIAPPLRSWDPSLQMWGSEDGDRIDVWVDGDRPTEARVRFDLRTPSEAFWVAVTQFTAMAETSLQTEAGVEVPPRLVDLTVALEGSRAARFVEDPTRYFNRLRAGGLEDV